MLRKRSLALRAFAWSVHRIGYTNANAATNGEHRLLDELAGLSVVLDVGANVGGWTAALLARHPEVSVYAFEPDPDCIRELRERFKNDGRVSVIEAACSDGDGEAPFYTVAGANTWGSLVHRDLRKYGYEMIPSKATQTIRIDTFCDANECDRVDLLKIDTEGGDLQVLRGAARILARTRFVQFEFGGTAPDAGHHFRDFYDVLPSFQLYRLLPDGLLPLGPYRESYEIAMYSNYLAVNECLAFTG